MSTNVSNLKKDKIYLSKKEAAELARNNQQVISNMFKELINKSKENLKTSTTVNETPSAK
jgi:hypothetical protein